MRLMVMWTSKDPEIQILTNTLQDRGHEIVYWVGMYGGEQYCPAGAVFHDHYDAWDGKPAAAFADTVFTPPDTKLIQEMRDTESITLTMMNKHFDATSVDERRRIYYTMLAYWAGVIDRLRPEAIVFPSVPHTVYNYILYELARRRGIATTMFEQAWVSDRLLAYHDFKEGSRELESALSKNMGLKITESDLSPDLQKFLREQEKKEPVPVYVTELKKSDLPIRKLKARAQGALSSITRGVFFKELFRFVSKHFGANLRNEYSRCTSPVPSADTPFVYVPLSFQPERTSSPQGYIFVDQILIIETVAAALPAGWKVVVKEHPVQWSSRGGIAYSSARYRGYYQRISQIPNVILVPMDTSSFALIEQARAVAASSGSAGWEALLRGKPMVNFGYPWYRDCPGVFFVTGAESCKKTLLRIQEGVSVPRADILRFLKSLDEASYRACMEYPMDEWRTISEEETMQRIADAVVRELSSFSDDRAARKG